MGCWIASQVPAGEVFEPIWPAMATLFLAFAVARNFASVYECVVDTIFVCAMRDKEEYGSSHMGEELQRALAIDQKQLPRRNTDAAAMI